MTVQDLIDKLTALPENCKARTIELLDSEDGMNDLVGVWPVRHRCYPPGQIHERYIVVLTQADYDLSDDFDIESPAGERVTSSHPE